MMSEQASQRKPEEDSPVGDVRRVRAKLSERFGNDVRRLGDFARQTGEEKARELGCQVIRKPSTSAELRSE